ncbi:MAG: hypothetical protein U0836_19380 [Pirellulales bacterium]
MSQRTKIGWLALALLLSGAALLTGIGGSQSTAIAAAFLRVGAVLGALWLAYAELSRIPARLWLASAAALVVFAARPRWWPVALAVFAIALLARPARRRG